ncbi:MAG: cytochrome [Caulobacteraceae bacterium]|nr:cytochrome [Caulobacteraceae bacterium]
MTQRRSFPAARLSVFALGALAGVLCLVGPQAAPAAAPEAGNAARGAYLFAAGDCAGCHTDTKAKGAPLAGGPPMVTDFGVFFAPNITPDKTNGIGAWSAADFHRAMREGKGKKGELLYPVFPYPAFAKMTDADIADLWAYLKTVPASPQPSKPQQAKAPYGIRPLLLGWRALYFHPGPLAPVAGQSPEWNRGRYLAEAVAHCGECHSPRNNLGAIEEKSAYAGNPAGPDDQKAPNITSDPKGLGKMDMADLEELLKTGAKPDGDYVADAMALVVDGLAKLTPADRHAIAVYIKSLPARPSTPKKGPVKAG